MSTLNLVVQNFVLSSTYNVSKSDRDVLVDLIVDEHDNNQLTELDDDLASEITSDYFDSMDNNDDLEYYADQSAWDDSGECYGNYQYPRNEMGEPL